MAFGGIAAADVVGGTVGAMWTDLVEAIDPYHPRLAVTGAVLGAAVAVVLLVVDRVGRPDRERRLPRLAVATAAACGGVWVLDLVPGGAGIVAMVVGVLLIAVGIVFPGPTEAPLVAAMAVVSLAGAWAAVPDTESPLVALASVAVPVVVGAVRSTRVVDRLAATLLVVFVAWAGSAGRSEIVGGIGCVGLLVSFVPARPTVGGRFGPGGVSRLALHVGVVAVASRLVTRIDRAPAIAVTAALLVVGSVADRSIATRAGATARRQEPGDPDAPGHRTPGPRPPRRRARRPRRR